MSFVDKHPYLTFFFAMSTVGAIAGALQAVTTKRESNWRASVKYDTTVDTISGGLSVSNSDSKVFRTKSEAEGWAKTRLAGKRGSVSIEETLDPVST